MKNTISKPITAKRPFRTAYMDPNRIQFTTTDSRTEQSHKDETDINQILAKYIKGDLMEHHINHAQNYGDFTGADFQEAQNIIALANSMFEELPSSVRTRFTNDPSQFLDFVNDENNHEEMVKMGLANPPSSPVNDEPVETRASAAETSAADLVSAKADD
jgi:phage internal scaffolding protein